MLCFSYFSLLSIDTEVCGLSKLELGHRFWKETLLFDFFKCNFVRPRGPQTKLCSIVLLLLVVADFSAWIDTTKAKSREIYFIVV